MIHEIINNISQSAPYITWQEWLSTVCQIMSVYYARKNNILVYPTGIVGVLLASWVYFFVAEPALYAEGTLNLYYLGMSMWGWYNWVQKKTATDLVFPISWCNTRKRIKGVSLGVIAWVIIYLVLINFTNSDTPASDACVSGSAVIAMWWMAQRKIEHWIAWMFSNLIAVPLNFYKELYLFGFMYIVFLVMAYLGYRDWKAEVTPQRS